eukprot:16437696-Heterocapsa_arctica.AAC.1
MVGTNVTTEVEKINERMGGIEEMCAAVKEITERGLKDIEKNFASEHDYVREKVGHVLEDIHEVRNMVRDQNNKRKKDEMEEDKPATEASDAEEEEPKTGAQRNDMGKYQSEEVKKWLEDNLDRKA